jgi:hypothetical protein
VVDISLQVFLSCFVIFDVFFHSCTVPLPCLTLPGVLAENGVVMHSFSLLELYTASKWDLVFSAAK